MSNKPKKRFFANHSKSSAVVISLVIHAILIVVALSFVAVTVIQREDNQFAGKQVVRPRKQLKKLKVPVKIKKQRKPKLRKRLVAKNLNRKIPEIQMPEITGIKGGIGSMGGDGGVSGIGFSMPEIDFFGAKAKGEKVVFVVHFGPMTGVGLDATPYTRMTAYIIRKRLEDMVVSMPEYTLFNVISYYVYDAVAIAPSMMLATADNKQKVVNWMESVNPLEGNYDNCFDWKGARQSINQAKGNWPTLVDHGLPFYSLKWAYPYQVPQKTAGKYLPEGKNYIHWSRGVAWAILTQKPDTIFVLTTNYVDSWGLGDDGEPSKIMASYKKMFMDIYGPDKKTWPTINVVVLTNAGAGSQGAYNVLNSQFSPIWKGTKGTGSVIEDISEYMTEEEKELMHQYRLEYGTSRK